MISNFGFYLVRRPVRSVDQLQDIHQQLAQRSVELVLKEFFNGDLLAKEAILIASPSFYARMKQWLRGEEVSEKEQLLITLYKYFLRSATRCTPFGLFSCCAVGHTGDESNITIPSATLIRKHISLDAEILHQIADALTGKPAIRNHLTLIPNTSLYNTGYKYHYIERDRTAGENRSFLSAAAHSKILTCILDRSQKGATIPELLALLKHEGYRRAESLMYINALIENQILVFETRPRISGPDFLSQLCEKLTHIPDAADFLYQLNLLQEDMKCTGNIAALQSSIERKLKSIAIQPANTRYLKVDSYFETSENRLSESVLAKLRRNMNDLLVLDQSQLPQVLAKFKNEFVRKYQHREIPLTTALDPDTGIGYAQSGGPGSGSAPMLESLGLFSEEDDKDNAAGSWWQGFVLDKYIQCLRAGNREIRLTKADLAEISAHREKQRSCRNAGSFFVFGNLLAESAAQLDRGDFTFNLLTCQGPSAVNMLARFSSGISGLDEMLRQCTAAEEALSPDVIFAEIVHDPEGHAGNVVNRPALYKYEIPYLGQASVFENQRILLSDLMISVRNNEIVLRSVRLNKRIIPRLSNMHNFRNGLPVYRFLCDLQWQDAGLHICWDWSVLQKQSHLPRVTYENVIVSREKWQLRSAEFRGISDAELLQTLKEQGIPQKIMLAAGDNELLIDTSICFSIKMLRDLLRKQDTILLTEYLGEAHNCWLSNGKEKYFSEFVFPFQNSAIAPIPGFSLPACKLPAEQLRFGSEWLYLKVYTCEKSGEQELLETLYAVVNRLFHENQIQLFFFIRYHDPDPHFRLRFKGKPHEQFYLKVLSTMHQMLDPLIARGIVHKIQTDTYERELERYGYDHIQKCEVLFQIHSLDTLHYLTENKRGETERFLFAIRKIDQLLYHSNYMLSRRKLFLEKLKEAYFQEFKGDTALRKNLNAKFQEYKFEIMDVLASGEHEHDPIQLTILKTITSPASRRDPGAMLASIIHMLVNRIFAGRQRAYELLIYHCLFKHYDGQLARQMKSVASAFDFAATSG